MCSTQCQGLTIGKSSPEGIGFHIAHCLVLKNATVFLGARNAQKAEDAIKQMLQMSPCIDQRQLRPFVVDLGDLKAVQQAARAVVAGSSRLDILIHNAGLLARPLKLDRFGISELFSINHLAPFVLTQTLMPLFKATARTDSGIRIVTVSSLLHVTVPEGVRFESKEDFNRRFGSNSDMLSSIAHYGLSKLANIAFARRLQQELDEEGIPAVSLSLHPGRVRTASIITMVGAERVDAEGDWLTPQEGALTSLFAAADPVVWNERNKYAGEYLVPFGLVGETSRDASNESLAEQLWKLSEEVVTEVLQEHACSMEPVQEPEAESNRISASL